MNGLTAADLIFDPNTHTTTTPWGHDVPHVTTVLRATHLSVDFEEEVVRGSRWRRLVLDNAGARGTAVHADCHAFDDDDIVWESVDERVLPYVDAWRCFRQDHGLVPLAHGRERRLYHPVYHYTGTLDGVFCCALRERRNILVDIKTGDPANGAPDLQTAAYQAAWERERPGDPIEERWAVWLRPGMRVPYRVFNYSALPDADAHLGVFLAALTVYNEQRKRGRRI